MSRKFENYTSIWVNFSKFMLSLTLLYWPKRTTLSICLNDEVTINLVIKMCNKWEPQPVQIVVESVWKKWWSLLSLISFKNFIRIQFFIKWCCKWRHDNYMAISFLQVWSHLLKKSLMENFTFCAVSLFQWTCAGP